MRTRPVAPARLWLGALIVFGGGVLGLAVPRFLDLVVALGHYIPSEDVVTDYVTGVVWAMVLAVSILAWPVPFRDRRALLLVWIVKSLITLGFMLLYEANYFLDAYLYFEESRQSEFTWEGLGVGGGSQNIISVAWLHNQVLPESYHALKVSFAMVGLLAVYLFYRAAILFLRHEDVRVFYVLALFPSILFWSSIFGKDPIVLLGIALCIYGVVAWFRTRLVRYLLLLALGLGVVVMIRVWLVPILLAPLAIFALRGLHGIVPRTAFMVFSVAAFLFSVTQFMHMFQLETTEDVLATLDVWSKAGATGGSAQEITVDFTSLGDVIAFMPQGAFTALFRPLPGEVLNFFGWLAGIENLALLLLLGFALIRARWKDLKDPLVVWGVLLVITWASVYGFVSYQNLGTAVRFKLQILPILVGLLLYFVRRRISAKTLLAKQRYSLPLAKEG